MRSRHEHTNDGLAEFVAARGAAMLRLGWLLTADRDAAADLVQDALLRALPKWGSIEPAAREAYLRTVIRTAWIDGWRRQGRGRLSVVPADPVELAGSAGPADGADDLDIEGFGDRAELAAALAQLPPGQRAVLVLRFYEDQTEVQTARALGCSVSTVKSQCRSALGRLRQLLLAPDPPGTVPSSTIPLSPVPSSTVPSSTVPSSTVPSSTEVI